jgi:hypothetical protein
LVDLKTWAVAPQSLRGNDPDGMAWVEK